LRNAIGIIAVYSTAFVSFEGTGRGRAKLATKPVDTKVEQKTFLLSLNECCARNVLVFNG